MKTITLEMDNESGSIYEGLSPENKRQFVAEVSLLLKEKAYNARSARLSSLIHQINNQKDCSDLNADILLELLPID